MTGGGGTKHVENKYDDQWIKDWQKDAEKKFTNKAAEIKGLQHVQKNLMYQK